MLRVLFVAPQSNLVSKRHPHHRHWARAHLQIICRTRAEVTHHILHTPMKQPRHDDDKKRDRMFCANTHRVYAMPLYIYKCSRATKELRFAHNTLHYSRICTLHYSAARAVVVLLYDVYYVIYVYASVDSAGGSRLYTCRARTIRAPFGIYNCIMSRARARIAAHIYIYSVCVA